LKQRHIRFTPTAERHVSLEKAWWLANRDHPEIFADELEQALKIVAILPGVGAVYAHAPIPSVRRVYLRRIALHLYYTFDEDQVIIRALWSARREHGPELAS
jgi:plasmid stabilization system protein ParE